MANVNPGRHRLARLARKGELGEMNIAPLRTPRDVTRTLYYLMNRWDTAAARDLMRRVRYSCFASKRGWGVPVYRKLVSDVLAQWGETSHRSFSVFAWLDPDYTKKHVVDDAGRCRDAGTEQNMMYRFWRLGECRGVSHVVSGMLRDDDDELNEELYDAVTSYEHNETGRQFTSDGEARGTPQSEVPRLSGPIADMVRSSMSKSRVSLDREINRWLCGVGLGLCRDRDADSDAYDKLLASRIDSLRSASATMVRLLGDGSRDIVKLAVQCAKGALKYAASCGMPPDGTLRDALAICLASDPDPYDDDRKPRYCAYGGRYPLPDEAILALLDQETFLPWVHRRGKSRGWIRGTPVDVEEFKLVNIDTDNMYREVWLDLRAGWIDEGESYDPEGETSVRDSDAFESWEPYEYYVVEGLVKSALERHGERVIEIPELGDVWLRGCTGQSVILDGWASAEFRRLTAPNQYGEYDPFLDRLIA